ncbi:MAG: hypothetical protein IJP14_01775, partial [Clostridia bacterium]|nr:hypothetical protein [Clostridia bacterium]
MKTTFSRFLAVTMALVLVLTCMISGFAVSVAAEDTATEPTFGVNLFTNKAITKTIAAGTSGDKGGYYAMDEFMLEGFRYVMRFEAKGPATSVSPNPGKWSQNVTTVDSTEWITYQTAFTAAAMNDEVARLWVSITMSNTTATEYGDFQMRNVELLYAPADGRFNLVQDSGFENASGFSFFQDQINDGGAELVQDPFGSDNQVIHLIQGADGTSYNNLPKIFDEIDYSKAFKIRMKLYGSLRFTCYAGVDTYMKNPGANKDSGQHACYESVNGWTTIEYFIDIKNNWNYQQFVNITPGGGGAFAYIDDLEIYEIDPNGATSWTVAPTTKVDAVPGTLDLSAYTIITTPANSSPYGARDASASGYIASTALDTGFTWTVADSTTNYYVSDSGFTGSEIDALTVTNAGRATLKATGNSSSTQYSLANVKPTLTVTDGTKTLTTKVEWEYTSHPFKHGDFENGTNGWGGGNSSAGSTANIQDGIGFDGSRGYMAAGPQLYSNQPFFLKPNATYRITAKIKTDATGSFGMGAYSAGPYNLTYTAATSSAAAGKGWFTVTGSIVTADAPAWGYNSININAGNADTPSYIDDIVIELMDDNANVIVGGDFDAANGGTVRMENVQSGTVYDHILPGEIEGGIGGNTTGMIKMNAGIAGGNGASSFYPDGFGSFKAFHAYKVTFKHYGGAGKFTTITWSQAIVAAGGGTKSFAATTEWTEVEMYFVGGTSIVNNGNWSYLFYFDSSAATEPVYIDDFAVTEVTTTYNMRGLETSTLQDQVNLKYGALTISDGKQNASRDTIREFAAGSDMTVTVTPTAGYLPVPGTLELVTLSGKRTPILNTALTGMSES